MTDTIFDEIRAEREWAIKKKTRDFSTYVSSMISKGSYHRFHIRTRRYYLIRAAALIVAEVERMDRESNKEEFNSD